MKYKCAICGQVIELPEGATEVGVLPGTTWETLPGNFSCPVCGAPKSVFRPYEEPTTVTAVAKAMDTVTDTAISEEKSGTTAGTSKHISDIQDAQDETLRELSAGEIAAICSSLAKSCEKQRKMPEKDAWNQLADYYKSKARQHNGKTFTDVAELLAKDMADGYPAAYAAATAAADRGALRSLGWSESVSELLDALLQQFAAEGEALLTNTRIYVCDICGFIYIGDTPPDNCPLCGVPKFKITPMERR